MQLACVNYSIVYGMLSNAVKARLMFVWSTHFLSSARSYFFTSFLNCLLLGGLRPPKPPTPSRPSASSSSGNTFFCDGIPSESCLPWGVPPAPPMGDGIPSESCLLWGGPPPYGRRDPFRILSPIGGRGPPPMGDKNCPCKET